LKGPIENSSKCVIGFDVWGTLFDLNKIFDAISIEASKRLRVETRKVQEGILKAYEDAKKLRRLNPNITPQELLVKSRVLMARALGVEVEVVDDVLKSAFRSVGDEVLFNDVKPALSILSSQRIRMGIIGNVLFWPSEYTKLLLESTGIIEYFETLVFSDITGSTKPDRGIFLVFAEKMGVEPSRIIYVGDNVIEDVGGALSAGAIGVLISRGVGEYKIIPELNVAVIRDLKELIHVYRFFCS